MTSIHIGQAVRVLAAGVVLVWASPLMAAPSATTAKKPPASKASAAKSDGKANTAHQFTLIEELRIAAETDDLPGVRRVLAAGADINGHDDDGQTALQVATGGGEADLARGVAAWAGADAPPSARDASVLSYRARRCGREETRPLALCQRPTCRVS